MTLPIAKVIAYAETGFLDICAGVKRQVFCGLKCETRLGEHGVEDPLPRKFPANSHSRYDRIFSFHVNSNAEDKLHIWAINVGAADDERHIEVFKVQIARAVKPGLRFDPE